MRTDATVAGLLAAGGRRLAAAAGGAAAGRMEAGVLLAAALGRPGTWLWAHPDAVPPPAARRRFAGWARRRAATRIPVALLTGRREFMGLDLELRRGVFIPRPETEGLV